MNKTFGSLDFRASTGVFSKLNVKKMTKPPVKMSSSLFYWKIQLLFYRQKKWGKVNISEGGAGEKGEESANTRPKCYRRPGEDVVQLVLGNIHVWGGAPPESQPATVSPLLTLCLLLHVSAQWRGCGPPWSPFTVTDRWHTNQFNTHRVECFLSHTVNNHRNQNIINSPPQKMGQFGVWHIAMWNLIGYC